MPTPSDPHTHKVFPPRSDSSPAQTRPARTTVTRISARKEHGVSPSLIGMGLVFFILIGIFLLSMVAAGGGQRSAPVLPIKVVTAVAQPTSVLPFEYILSLSVTPSAVAFPTSPPVVVSGFASATPAYNPIDYIVYVCYMEGSDEICLMNADGSGQQRLTNERGTDWYPSFSPDGQTIVFSSQRGGNFDIYLMDLNGENIQQLTRSHGANYAPAFSPDGMQIVFTSTYGAKDEQNIWLMNADGSHPTQLTFSPYDDIDPMWSPDGRQISFASNRSGSTELFVMDTDGTNVRQLTNGVNIGGRNDWSPDGRYLIFYAGPPSDKDIYMVAVECANLPQGCDPSLLRQMTRGGNNKGPSFSPDGQWIVYASGADGDNEIFVMRLDGSEVYQLTFNHRPDWQPRWRP